MRLRAFRMSPPALRLALSGIFVIVVIGAAAPGGFAQDSNLAGYFGFDGLEIIKIGERAGPLTAADMDGDGLTDLVVVNNQDSRIELHHQRAGASPDDVVEAPARVNEFPEHWRFRRELLSVTHRVSAVVAHDFDGDGLRDLIYAGLPAELVFVRQATPGVFEVTRRHRVKNLAAGRDGLAIADFIGDAAPELVAIVDGKIRIWPLENDSLGPMIELAAGKPIVAFVVEDYDGDGRLDLAAAIPDDPAPVRIWFGGLEDGVGILEAEVRLDMPPLIELAPVRLPGVPAARLVAIERASKRIVVYAVSEEQVEDAGDRDAAMRVHGFTDPGNRNRDHAVVDLDGDGLLDLVTTDTEANAIVTYRQREGRGLAAGLIHPSLSELTYLVAGNVDDDPAAELFVLSEKEGVVARGDVEANAGVIEVPFPRPINVSPGHKPTALNLVSLDGGPRLAVVAKDTRDYVLDLIDMAGDIRTIALGKLSRSPETIVGLDADQDGRTDLMLFTREKPMTMLWARDDGFELLESKDMGQFGLVEAAEAHNIATFDVDGNGREELLIANRNYVRALRYELEPAPGVSPGWQVVEQINAHDSSSNLVSLAILGDRIVAADKENDRLIVMARTGGTWGEVEALAVRGFTFTEILAGSFSGDGRENIMAVGDDGFAVFRFAGERVALRELDTWRTSDPRRTHHEIQAGDLNGDGFTDLAVLDAGEQMCDIFTFSESGRMLFATGFRVFESTLFTGGDARQFEPSQSLIVDVTGDGANDLVLLAHDRILIYPQMVE